MGERSKHTSMLPDLHRLLNYSSIPYQNLSWNLPRNPALIAHKISFQQSPNSTPASSVVAPNTHSNPRKQNHVSMPVRCASQVAAVIATAPIERVCILMQCQNEMIKYGHLSSPYKGMKDCFIRTIKYEGFLSLWPGSSINVIGNLTSSLTREVLFPITPRVWHLPLLMLNCQFLYPLFYARVCLANDVKVAQKFYFSMDSTKSSFSNDGVGSRKFSGASDVLYKKLKSEGIVGLYRGYLPACLGAVGYYLCVERVKSLVMQNKEKKIGIIPACIEMKFKATLSSEMADRCEHTSMFPDLHWLYHSPRSSHILGSTIVAQNLLRDPALLVHRNLLQPSPNISSSSVITPKKQVHPREQNPGSYVILQGMSRVISASAVAPIERVYSLMQCQNEMLKYGHLSTPYKGMMDCFSRTIKNEGVLSLWRGNSMNVITP